MLWFGDSKINILINYLYKGQKKNILCKNNKKLGDFYYVTSKLSNIFIHFLIIYLFLLGFIKKKII